MRLLNIYKNNVMEVIKTPELTKNNFGQESQKEDSLVVVDLPELQCEPCKELMPSVCKYFGGDINASGTWKHIN